MKVPPKIKHFIWRALSGALAVKERLQTRRIQLDTTCQQCGRGVESICHVLFTCDKATEVWKSTNLQLPPTGFSRTSDFLNLLHLVSMSKNSELEESSRIVFPWVLWHLWKARNGLAFENRVIDRLTIAGNGLNLDNCSQFTSRSGPKHLNW